MKEIQTNQGVFVSDSTTGSFSAGKDVKDSTVITGNGNHVTVTNFIKIDDKEHVNEKYLDDPSIPEDLARGEFILTGKFENLNEQTLRELETFLKAMAAHCKKKSVKDIELTIYKAEEGSIKIQIDTDPETLELLKSLFKSGELTELLKFPIEDIRIISTPSEAASEKSRLIDEIYSFPRKIRDLRGADLRCADLRCADLSGADLRYAHLSEVNLRRADLSLADLRGANLRRADLSLADLRGANLSGANLIGANLSDSNLIHTDINLANLIGANLSDANLSGANLSNADLSGANLSDANLRGTIVTNAIFGSNQGISRKLKEDLIARGAKFIDEPGEEADVRQLLPR